MITDDMKIGYIAGLFEGEGHFKLQAQHGSRQISRYYFGIHIIISNKDLVLLNNAKTFLNDLDIRSTICRNGRDLYILYVTGWQNVDKTINLIYNLLDGNKKQQIKLYLEEFKPIQDRLPQHSHSKKLRMWTIPTFIQAMGVVDKIDSYKQHLRGIHDQEYFIKFLGETFPTNDWNISTKMNYSDYKCSICESDKTYTRRNGRQDWGYLNGKPVCKSCHQKEYERKRKLENVSTIG